MIIRPKYIEAMRPFIDVPLVKILAGVRRCGKSTILEMIENELLHRGISAENIIIKNYSEVKFTDFTFKDMYCDLIQSLGNKGRCYLFLDEVQEISGWEKCVNDIFEHTDADIYVIGSNSKLMSGEISTYLTGRYVLIPVYTLSFSERPFLQMLLQNS